MKTGSKKKHTLASMVGGSVAGLLFFILMPVIAVGAMLFLIGTRLVQMVVNNAGIATLRWRPLEAFFTGREKKK